MLAAVKRAEEVGQATLVVPPEFEGAAVAFLLTVGVAYFWRYKSRMGEETAPRSFTTLTEGADPKDASGAERWLDKLREHTWTATASEEGNVPSVGALVFHFLGAVLVLRIWNAACIGWMSIPALESFGYRRNESDGLEIVYNFQGRLKRVEEQVELVLKGCGCKKGCETRQCKCRKVGHSCSVGCRCLGCKNVPVQAVEAQRPTDGEDEERGTGREEGLREEDEEAAESEDKDAEFMDDDNDDKVAYGAGPANQVNGEESALGVGNAADDGDVEENDPDGMSEGKFVSLSPIHKNALLTM